MKPLEINVLSQMDPAFPRTHSIAAIRLCAALASQGHRVELVVPSVSRPAPPAAELFAAYDLEPSFELSYLSIGGGNGEYDSWTQRRLLARHVLRAASRDRSTVVISDGIRLALPYVAVGRLGVRRPITAPWLHEYRGTRLERITCANSNCVLATNEAILRDLPARIASGRPTFTTGNPIPRERIEFGRSHSKAQARERLGLDGEQPVIAYTGKLFVGMSELGYLLSAAQVMPECLFLLTGGRPPVVEHLTRELGAAGITNVRLAGMLPNPEETRFYQQAADVLVTYYSTDDLPYAPHHLPSKLAEYMSTGNAIVAADYPGVRDLLNPRNAVLVDPQNVDALVRGLRFAVENRDEAVRLGAQAQRDIAPLASESVGARLGEFLSALAENGDQRAGQ
jgi:glycosyltransferase involved in cell wall biosynthesis